VLAFLRGEEGLAANLLYGSGQRLMEALRLRVKTLISSISRSSSATGKVQKTVLPFCPKS